MKIIIEFPFPPIAKERARVTRFGAYTPARTKEFQRQIQSYARKYAPSKPLEIPLSVQCHFYLARPKKPKFQWPATRPDIDNYLKAVMDSLNGILWKDDSLIVQIWSGKHYTSANPIILLRVEDMETNE